MLLIALTINTNAQIPNSGFETWNSFGNYMEPVGWATTNPASAGSFYAVTRSTDHYPATVGDFSVRIENNIALLGDYSGMGIIMPETLDAPHPRFPITGHPTSLTGYYKFAPQGGDTMAISIQLYYNGSNVSWGIFSTTIAAASWTSFNIPLSGYSIADSAHISISPWYANGPYYVPHGNSVMYVDNLNFDNLIFSVSDESYNNAFSLYPNPASDKVIVDFGNKNINTPIVNIYNVIGDLVKSEKFQKNQVNVSDLENGVYIFEIISNGLKERQKLIIKR